MIIEMFAEVEYILKETTFIWPILNWGRKLVSLFLTWPKFNSQRSIIRTRVLVRQRNVKCVICGFSSPFNFSYHCSIKELDKKSYLNLLTQGKLHIKKSLKHWMLILSAVIVSFASLNVIGCERFNDFQFLPIWNVMSTF